MPPMANIVSGNTSVCMTPALVASFSTTLPATADACGVNASRPGPGSSSAGAGDAPFGDQQDAEHADQQDGGLQEQRRGVDGDGAHHGGASAAAVQVPSEHDDRHERGDQPAEAEHQLGGVALLTRQERLDEDTDDGHAEHDQHGGEQAVLDAGCGHRFIVVGPSAIRGAGSG